METALLEDLKDHFESLASARNLALNYDEKLFIHLLEQSEFKKEFKNRFFIQAKQTLIFKQEDFLTFLDLKNLSGSYTKYASKIGLAYKNQAFLKTSDEVVLNFAFKDGVIKGDQSKDKEKHNEIFFNEILAKDEIDVLFTHRI